MKRVGKMYADMRLSRLLLLSLMLIFLVNCEKEPVEEFEEANLKAKKNLSSGPYEFPGAVFDIAATPDGSIMVGLNDGDSRSIQLIKNGEIREMVTMDAPTRINGIAAIGTGNAFVTTEGSNLSQDGELYRVSNGRARMVADLAAYEFKNDPDAFEGNQWKNQLCEDVDPFDAGPQNNPFKVAAVSGNTALVADAAGNTLLSATTAGHIDWKAIFTPPTDDNGDYILLFNTQDNLEEIACYVQPVPTSVAVGPDGYLYVGELTGAVAAGLPLGLSRVWRLPSDANNVICSEESGPCEVFLNGLTSVIDLAFGPDGLLYVVEFDQASWLSLYTGNSLGGSIKAYDLNGELKKEITGLSFPSAITFDKKGNLWLLENNDIPGLKPTVRMLDSNAWE